MNVAYIRWKDACTREAAEPGTPATAELVELQEIGWIAAESDEAVEIAMEMESDGTPGRWRLTIPKVNIVEFRQFAPERMPKKRKR